MMKDDLEQLSRIVRFGLSWAAKGACLFVIGVMLYTWTERAADDHHAFFYIIDALIVSVLCAPFYMISRLIEPDSGR